MAKRMDFYFLMHLIRPESCLHTRIYLMGIFGVFILDKSNYVDGFRYMDLSLITRCSRLQLTRLLMNDDSLNIPDLTEISPSSLLSNNGYHIRQYKTSQIRLEVDR